MRRFMITAFNDAVVGTTPVYTDAKLNEILASTDQLAIQAVTDQVSVSGGTPTLTCAIEISADGRNWTAKAGTPEINNQTLQTTSTTVLIGTDAGTTPSLGLVRIKITLGGTTPNAHVRLNITGRDSGG